MSCALRDDASIDSAISTTRLPRPSAATSQVLSRIREITLEGCFKRKSAGGMLASRQWGRLDRQLDRNGRKLL